MDATSSCQRKGEQGGCQLLDGFALVVQAALAFAILLMLLWKRRNEKPQRPFSTWSLDVSKQFAGASMIHCLNIQVSYLSHNDNGGGSSFFLLSLGSNSNNMCVWYLVSILYDTTIGLALLYFWLHFLTWALEKLCHLHIPKDYGHPPFTNQLTPWAQQTAVFLMAELLMKLCQFWCFRHIPWFFRFGQWMLEWTEGNYHHQVILVMLIYPLIMNGIQFWVIDTMLKFNDLFIKKASLSTTTKEPILPYSYTYLDNDHTFFIPSSSPPLSNSILFHNTTHPNEHTLLLSSHS
ncbi:vacuolar membrane protein-domain-containing protein [Chlamydoabsidia padenii]|nr:vacuolar membrane protein-domain-containing protein [Chlamydoabsidia padenii]